MAIETVLSLIEDRARARPDATAIFTRVGAAWRPMSISLLLDEAHRFARALRRKGIGAGDRVAIMASTRAEWLVAELGTMIAHAVVVGIEAYAIGEHLAQIFKDADPAGLVIESESQLERVPAPSRDRLRVIVTMGPRQSSSTRDVEIEWKSFLACGARHVESGSSPRAASGDDERFVATPREDVPATFLYTSGTTGKPKAIVYRHHQLALACRSIQAEFPSVGASEGTTICWLPMAALFQRMMNYVALTTGVAIHFVNDPAAIVHVSREVRPTYFIGVPRFFEKLYQGIEEQLARKPAWLRKSVLRSLEQSRPTHWTKRRLFDRILLRRLRNILGNRLRFVITGSAPAPAWMLEYFGRLGILLLEAYGISENAVPIAANRPGAHRPGSVGKVFRSNEVKIAPDGEILVRGAGLFEGYFGDAHSTTAAFDSDGFMRTGDLGRFDDDGFLYIEGRKGEIFKTSTGRRFVPSRLEAIYKRIPYIDQIIVVGHGRPYPAALLVVNMHLLRATMCEQGGHTARVTPDWANVVPPTVKDRITMDMDAAAADLARHERIRCFGLLEHPFTLEGGELTPSLKLRRSVIERKYVDLIDCIYVSFA